jgi:hypothetical protein
LALRDVDLTPHLVAGRNAHAAVVWNFSQLAPQAQMSNRTISPARHFPAEALW